jgi:DNA primase
MIEIWGTPVIAEVGDILDLLILELRASGSHLLEDRKETNKNIMLTCIAHGDGSERKPSMGISTEDVVRGGKEYKAGIVNCFTCGYTADMPTFVSHCFGHNDAGYQGFKWITANFVNLSIENRRDLDLDMSRNTFSDAQNAGIEESELALYRFIHPYMYDRKLTDKVIDYFDVGYDREKDCLTFPVHHHETGQAMFFQRRAIGRKQFLNDVTTLKGEMLYGLYQVYQNLSWIEEIYVVESPIDALTLWTRRKAGVATMQAIPTSHQIKLLKKLPVRAIVCAQDNDDAGDNGARRLKEELGNAKIVYRAMFSGKDINDLDEEQIDNLKRRLL